MNEDNLTIVPYDRQKHEAAFFDFVEKGFGEKKGKRRQKVLTWMHDDMPGREREPLRHLIVDGERIAGSLGCMPAEFYLRGERVEGRHGHDIMVDPSYRGRGLGTRLMHHYAELNEFTPFGLWMTGTTHHIALAGGWDDMPAMTNQNLVLNPAKFMERKDESALKKSTSKLALGAMRSVALKRAAGTLRRSGATIETIEAFDPAMDEQILPLLASHGVTRFRDAEFLNWRYVRHPHLAYRILTAQRDGRLAGYVIWRPALESDEEKRSLVVDFLVANGDTETLRPLFSKVVLDAEAESSEVVTVLSTQSWVNKALRAMGFAPKRTPQTWVVTGWRGRMDESWLQDHDQFHVCLGDSDGDLWTGSQ